MTFLLIFVALVTKLLIGWLSVTVVARKMVTILSKATLR